MFSPSMEEVLPENLILDVLSRLPVKTIIRCKLLCKKWRDLVSDSYFVQLHLSRSRQCLMIHEGKTSDLPARLQWVEIEHGNLDPVKTLDRDSFPVGSVNGLICCCGPYDNSIHIFNPVLEEYMLLPKPELKIEGCMSYGFGVPMDGEYKVIFRGRRNPDYTPYEYEVDVYTLGTDQWRVLGQTLDHLNKMNCGPGVFLSSHVYWLGIYGQIYDFDLTTETFELFPSPPGREKLESKKMLGVLKGRLSRISWCSLGLDIWVMKGDSWNKEIAIIQEIIRLTPKSQPLCLMDGLNGTSVLMLLDKETNQFVAYCLNTNTILHLEWPGCLYRISYIMTYRPSFLKLITNWIRVSSRGVQLECK
ncbi:putative F-box domain, kelch-type beta propeller, F-box associated interaction [Helianthus debilis subsp. tardiflorus]